MRTDASDDRDWQRDAGEAAVSSELLEPSADETVRTFGLMLEAAIKKPGEEKREGHGQHCPGGHPPSGR